MMRQLLLPILLLLPGLLLAPVAQGVGNLPDLSDPSGQTLSPEEAESIGREVIRELYAEGLMLDDPELAEYLQSLGQRLVSYSRDAGEEYNFFFIRSDEINAFALPGRHVGINAGLLMATRNESELAGVLAHEIAHVTQRHIARQVEQAGRVNLATMAGLLAGILVGAATGESQVTEAAVATASAAQLQSMINYTRAHETEADRVGIVTLAGAGFDPEAMATMFEMLDRQTRLSGRSKPPEFLSTHPVSGTRITEARDRASRFVVESVEHSRSYALMKARARVLVSEPHDALEYFRANLRSAGDGEHQALRYGLALALTRTGQAGEAREVLTGLVAENEDVLYFHNALARAAFVDDDQTGALAAHRRALRLFPRNVAVTQAYADTLLHLGRGREALDLMVGLLPLKNPSPEVYRMLALGSSASGELADAHYFMAEAYLITGQLSPAISQLRIALAQPDLNATQRARMEARLEQLVQHVPRGRHTGMREEDAERRD